jgi:hypothetical protein
VSFAPKVDLIDGERLCDLVLSEQVGVQLVPIVDVGWFNPFEWGCGPAAAADGSAWLAPPLSVSRKFPCGRPLGEETPFVR